jgi:hypothetical protein
MDGPTEAINAAELRCEMSYNTPQTSKAALAAAMTDTAICRTSVNQSTVPESTCS